MPGMLDLLFLKSGAPGAENEGERAYLLMLEKASMLIVLFFILMVVIVAGIVRVSGDRLRILRCLVPNSFHCFKMLSS